MTTTMDSAHGAQIGPIQRGWNAFTVWRRSRPFWSGLWTLIAALELWSIPFMSEILTRGTLNLSVAGITGVSTMAMTPMMVIMAFTIWFAPSYRVFAGVFTIICGLLSMVVSNFGGFVIGMLLAVLGGGLAFAWSPRLTPEQLAAQERAVQAYHDALAGDMPASARTPLGAPAQTYGFAPGPDAEPAFPGQNAPAPAPASDAAPAAPARIQGTVAPTLPQNRPNPSAPLADTLNQQRTASDSVPNATAPTAPPQDFVPPLPSAEDTPLGA